MRTEALPHDDTPTGHSFTAAWLAMFAFGALALFGLAIAAMWMVERLFA